MRAKALAVGIACVLVAGCGGGGDSAESVAKGFIAAIVNKDGKRMCSYMTDSFRRSISATGVAKCPDLVGGTDMQSLGTRVVNVSVSGDRATAETDTASFKLVKQDGKWRVSP